MLFIRKKEKTQSAYFQDALFFLCFRTLAATFVSEFVFYHELFRDQKSVSFVHLWLLSARP